MTGNQNSGRRERPDIDHESLDALGVGRDTEVDWVVALVTQINERGEALSNVRRERIAKLAETTKARLLVKRRMGEAMVHMRSFIEALERAERR